MAFLQSNFSMAEQQSTRAPPAPTASESESAFFSQRSRRQLGLFAAGVGFFALSTVVTRRSIVKRYKASIPKFYQPNNQPNTGINGAFEALEALNIATINVFSVGIMATGGFLWAFDISSLDDIRQKVRRNMGGNPEGTDEDAEKEIEEWFGSVLARKEFKALRGEKGIKTKEEEEAEEDEKKS